MENCRNCGREFQRSVKGKRRFNQKTGNRNYLFCCSDCYWQYKLKQMNKKSKFDKSK